MGKRYDCPYCSQRLERPALIKHINKSHQESIPDGYTSTQIVFNLVNKTTGGKCRVCGKPTEWREDIGRYNALCNNPNCKQKMRDDYKKNMLRVRGTYNILNDPEQQTKMLAGRSISGEYQFQDGGKVGYTGTFERKCLEFMDIVMHVKSEDIISPGPAMEYMYNGEKHIYIPDFYYVPYNLIIEVKDGGNNPNTKESPGMKSSRERTIEKERMITDKGVYNYIRLTNNNFQQLLEIFMDIKMALTENDPKKIVKVNESSEDTIIESTLFENSMNDYTNYIVNGNYDYLDKYYEDIKRNRTMLFCTPKRGDELPKDVIKYIEELVYPKCEADRKKYWDNVSYSKGDYPFKFFRYISNTDIDDYMSLVFDNIKLNPTKMIKNNFIYQYNFSKGKCRMSTLIFIDNNKIKSIIYMPYDKIDSWKTIKPSNESAIIAESAKYPDEVPDEIIELIKRLNSYDYGFVKKNGEKVKGMKNFFEDYRSLSISEFEKYEIGVCWDYVHYEADWFKKHGYKYETFYIQVQDEDNDCPSHTYLVFYLPGNNKPYYFESSWGKFQGIEKFNNITELHNTVKDRHIENAESKCDPKSYFREKYDAESKSWEHLSCGDYMVKVSKGRIKIDESVSIIESTKSSVNPNYKPKGRINLSSLKMVHITDSVIDKYKKEYPFLKHVRCKDTKEYICDGYIWFDEDKLVAMVGSCEYRDDKTKWIVSLEITKDYKGYGLSKQILDYATKTMKCKYLSVNKNNKLAKKIYDDYGFKVYQESDAMYYMTIDKSRNESVINEFVLQKVDKSVRLFHGSPIQGLKYLEPRQESINTNVGDKKLVYATDDIRFAACFGGIWHDDIAKQGTWDGWNTITMGMSNKVDLTKPCSIYELENDGSFIQIATKEMVSSQKVKIKREIRYNSYLDALKDTGVEIITLDEYHKRLAKSKQSKYETALLEGSPLIDRYILDLNGTPDKPTINGVVIEWDEIDRYCPINISNIPNYMGINLCSVHSIEWSRLSDGQLVDVIIKFIPWESETGVVESTVVKNNALLKEPKLSSEMLNESSRMTPEQLDAFYTELKKRLAEDNNEYLNEITLENHKCAECGYISKEIEVKFDRNPDYSRVSKLHPEWNLSKGDLGYIICPKCKTRNDILIATEMAYINEKGEKVPKKCPKCGGDVKVYLRGVPVFLCVDCEEYFGEIPCRKKRTKKSVKESADFIRHDISLEDITDEHLKSAFDKVIHMIKWCRMDSFAFCNVNEYSTPRKVSATSFGAGELTNNESAKEIIRVLNNNNSFSYGTFEASSKPTRGKYPELLINIVELHYYETVNKPEVVSESANADLTKFNSYHAELVRKGWNPKSRAGGWDEELYSKSIDFAIHNDIESYMQDKDKVEAHLFTMGEDYSAIYLGIITVYRTSNGNIDWEWAEQEDISQAYADYIKEEIQSTNESVKTEIDDLQYDDFDDEVWD